MRTDISDGTSDKDDDLSQSDESSDDEDDQAKPIKKEKSLGLLSTGFIKLFFRWKDVISLEMAARKLSSENIEENKIKTKVIKTIKEESY